MNGIKNLENLILRKYVLGLKRVGSSVIDSSPDDIDIAVFLDFPFDPNTRRFYNSLSENKCILGTKYDMIYVINWNGIDLLLMPALRGITPYHKKEKYDRVALSLEEALEFSPVARTPFHLKFLESLIDKEISKLRELKKDLKRLNLYREGISSIQLGKLIRKSNCKHKEFIMSEEFEDFIENCTDPSDDNRYLWASVKQKSYLVKLLKTYAKYDPKNYEELLVKSLENNFGLLLKFEKKIDLSKNERSKVLAYAKDLESQSRNLKWNSKIIDSFYKNDKIITYIIISEKWRKLSKVPEKYRKYINKKNIIKEKYRVSSSYDNLISKIKEI